MKECNFICYCDLKHSIFVEEAFLGKKVPIKLLNKYEGAILFPILRPGDNTFDLITPRFDQMICQEQCGDVSKDILPSGKQVLHPKFDRVCIIANIIDIETSDKNQTTNFIINEIEKYISKYIKCICLIHPLAIGWSYVREEGYVEPIKSYHAKWLNKGNWGGFISLSILPRMDDNALSTQEFFQIHRNITRNISLQYELLSDVYRCVERKEYREVILNCATIIEKTLKEQIGAYLDKENTTSVIKEHILKSADGFKKILEVMKKFGIPSDNCGTIKKGTIDIRNRVIHGGHFPIREEVEQAIEDAKLIIKQYNIPLFID